MYKHFCTNKKSPRYKQGHSHCNHLTVAIVFVAALAYDNFEPVAPSLPAIFKLSKGCFFFVESPQPSDPLTSYFKSNVSSCLLFWVYDILSLSGQMLYPKFCDI